MSSVTKRIFKFLCALTIVSFIVVGAAVYNTATVLANTSTQNKSIYELETRLGEIKTERSTISGQLSADRQELTSVEAEIASIDGEIELLREQSVIIDSLYDEWFEESENARLAVIAYEEQLEFELQNFDSMIRMSYMYGEDTYFSLIFGSENIGDFLSRMDMLEYHRAANKNVVSNLTNTISNLDNSITQYNNSLLVLSAYEDEQVAIREELETREAYSLQRKAELESNVSVSEEQLALLDSEEAQIEADLKARYEQQKETQTVPVYTGNGRFAIPTTNYRISSGFVNRISPITGKPEKHNGLDFAAPGGTPIYAADAGTVIDSRYSSSWGNVIQIDHGGGIVTLYAHCSRRIAQKGQVVQKGEKIAEVGTTGWSTGNHLHFTVYVGGVAVDPRGYLGI